MGVYPESFMAPMRKDVGVVLSRVDPAWHGGDSKLAGGSWGIAKSNEVMLRGKPATFADLRNEFRQGNIKPVPEIHLAPAGEAH
jgi:hypothetical protein